MLFGKNPQLYFPRARVRFIRYEGIRECVGAQMNVIKDVIFEGNILNMLTKAVSYLDTQIKEKTYLGADGLFVTEEEYPKFVRQEIIVNAITHRDYSIRGTDIQIKMFDDRIVVESPGRLPGLVKAGNIRHTHFSRNERSLVLTAHARNCVLRSKDWPQLQLHIVQVRQYLLLLLPGDAIDLDSH